jgi:hypothetical protein
VFHARSLFTRGLTIWDLAGPAFSHEGATGYDSPPAHARSQFRSLANPHRVALYSLSEPPAADAVLVRLGSDDHSLMAVREFRRVPLYASALSLTLFNARPGRSAEAVAAIAHFVERAVSVWEPAYLMLAQSLEQPRVSVLITGVHQGQALAGAAAGAFSLHGLLSEIAPMLEDPPEVFEYCREERAEDELESLISPHAV